MAPCDLGMLHSFSGPIISNSGNIANFFLLEPDHELCLLHVLSVINLDEKGFASSTYNIARAVCVP